MKCLESYDSSSSDLCWCSRCFNISIAICFIWFGQAIKKFTAQLKESPCGRSNKEIKFSVLKKLPPNCNFIKICICLDMDDIPHEAMVVSYSDKGFIRESYYDIHTGEYLGEHK